MARPIIAGIVLYTHDGMRRTGTLFLTILLTAVTGESQQPDAKFHAGLRGQQLKTVDEALEAILDMTETEQTAAWDAFIEKHAQKRIEALKHFQDPRLVPLFIKLTQHKDRRVQHRALTVLARLPSERVITTVRAALQSRDVYVRERAAVTLRELVAKANAAAEQNAYVRAILASGGIAAEHKILNPLEASPRHILWMPIPKGFGGGGGGGTRSRPRPPTRTKSFAWPTLHQAEGNDQPPYGWDGIAVYAIADGIVQNRYTASASNGYQFTIRHQLGAALYVIARYAGLDNRVFFGWHQAVKAGDPLGTVRPGYGHDAALNLTFFLGPIAHKRKIDSNESLAKWIRWSAPLVMVGRDLTGKLRPIATYVQRRQYARAYKLAVSVRDRAEAGSEVHADAVYAATLLLQVPGNALKRAQARLADGWPNAALADAIAIARAVKGIPGRAKLVAALERWQLDDTIAKATRAERQVEAATKRALAAPSAAQARAIVRPLFEKFKDTCLKPRLELLMQ